MRKRSLQDADYFTFFFLHGVETYNYSVKAQSDVIHCSIGKRPLFFSLSLSPPLSLFGARELENCMLDFGCVTIVLRDELKVA